MRTTPAVTTAPSPSDTRRRPSATRPRRAATWRSPTGTPSSSAAPTRSKCTTTTPSGREVRRRPSLRLRLHEHLVELKLVEQVAQVVHDLLRMGALDQLGDLPLTLRQAVPVRAHLLQRRAKLVHLRHLRRELCGNVERLRVERLAQPGLDEFGRSMKLLKRLGLGMNWHRTSHLAPPLPPRLGGRIFSGASSFTGG